LNINIASIGEMEMIVSKTWGKSAWAVWWNNVPEGIFYPDGLSHYRQFIGFDDKTDEEQNIRFRQLVGPHGPTLVKAYFARKQK